jgi:hypothetical protein
MKPFIALVLGVSIASTSNSSDGPRVDCPSGNCPLVQSPKIPVASGVKSVASAPAKVVRSVRSNQPVRSFFKRFFRRR